MDHATADSWSAYWAGANVGHACLPHAPAAVDAALRRFWQNFAPSLPSGARVADLCCGNGAVMRVLHTVRPDITLTGFDYALDVSAPDGTTIEGGVDCTVLPVKDGSVDAVTSQFGIEYAGLAAMRETARVLRSGGAMAMVLHHKDSVLVHSNAARWTALTAFIDSGLFARAEAVAQGGRAPDTGEIVAELARDCGGHPAVAELFQALQQALTRGPAALAAVLALVRAAERETTRLGAMQAAALDMAGIAAFAAATGMDGLLTIAPLTVTGHGVIAWTLKTA